MEQPEYVIVMKVVPQGVSIRDLYGRDSEGNIWKMTEGISEVWQIIYTAEEARKLGLIES